MDKRAYFINIYLLMTIIGLFKIHIIFSIVNNYSNAIVKI